MGESGEWLTAAILELGWVSHIELSGMLLGGLKSIILHMHSSSQLPSECVVQLYVCVEQIPNQHLQVISYPRYKH